MSRTSINGHGRFSLGGSHISQCIRNRSGSSPSVSGATCLTGVWKPHFGPEEVPLKLSTFPYFKV